MDYFLAQNWFMQKRLIECENMHLNYTIFVSSNLSTWIKFIIQNIFTNAGRTGCIYTLNRILLLVSNEKCSEQQQKKLRVSKYFLWKLLNHWANIEDLLIFVRCLPIQLWNRFRFNCSISLNKFEKVNPFVKYILQPSERWYIFWCRKYCPLV